MCFRARRKGFQKKKKSSELKKTLLTAFSGAIVLHKETVSEELLKVCF